MHTSIDVRFHEVDSQGHANHTAIVSWVAHCRVQLIDSLVKQSGCKGIDHVLVGLTINFRKEVFYPDRVDINGKIIKVGNTSVETTFHVHREDDEIANAICTNVFFDTTMGDNLIIPDNLRTLFLQY